MCIKDDANNHLSGSLWGGAQQLRNCSRKYGGESELSRACNRKLVTRRIRTWAPGWEPAVITTDWDVAEWESL